ncbi:MAG: PSD1 and planctomycete cytochrome C domain-containing protein [Gemmataceae bacterium]
MFALSVVFLSAAVAAPPSVVDEEFFEKQIRPILVNRCQGCHDAEKSKGGLNLQSAAGMLAGGDNGPAFDPKAPTKSLLEKVIDYTDDLKMPPKGQLPAAELQLLKTWLHAGAPWPKGGPSTPLKQQEVFDLQHRAATHWAWQAINTSRPRQSIDEHLKSAWAAAGLQGAGTADRRTRIRRVTLDLTGLLPTPAEVTAFEQDSAPNAWDRVIDRLLDSPAYGERWGRHWLDLVRYAETQGHEFDFEIPHAWRYRDTVIRAFQQDLPYTRFVQEQIAGDLLPPRRNPADGTLENISATGFWWLGEAKHSPVDSLGDQADRIDNMIDVFGKTFLGMTIACARCHDHKFDPIRTRDYYSLYGIVRNSRYEQAILDDPADLLPTLEKLRAARANLGTKPGESTAASWEHFGTGWTNRWSASGPAFWKPMDGRIPDSATDSVKLAGSLRSPNTTIEKPILSLRIAGEKARVRVILNGLQLIQDPIYGGLQKSIDHGAQYRWVNFDLRMWPGQMIHLEVLDDGPGWFRLREVRWGTKPLDEEREPAPGPPEAHPLEKTIGNPRRGPAMCDGPGPGRDERVFIRGNGRTLGEVAPRQHLEVFAGVGPSPARGSGRLELARAITNRNQPQYARVMVNRIWQHHFGTGLVPSPDDYGKLGTEPRLPGLLNDLTREFLETDSVKQLHRTILRSAAYQQQHTPNPTTVDRQREQDPTNQLWSFVPSRRVEAEVLRDTMLQVSGQLDRKPFGPGVTPHLTPFMDGRGRPGASGPLDGARRRSVYLQVRRNFLNPMLLAFDFPTPFTTIGRRHRTQLPGQSLVMLNNPFVLEQAQHWARATLAKPGSTDDHITEMYQTAFSRAPSPAERSACRAAVEVPGTAPLAAWTELAHALFMTQEFSFLP